MPRPWCAHIDSLTVTWELRLEKCLVCLLLLRPNRGAEYCDERVCLSAIISSELHIRSSPHLGRGSVLLWRRGDMLRISSFVDDVIFAHIWLLVVITY